MVTPRTFDPFDQILLVWCKIQILHYSVQGWNEWSFHERCLLQTADAGFCNTRRAPTSAATATELRRASLTEASLRRALLFGAPFKVLEAFNMRHYPKHSFQLQWSSRRLLYNTEYKSYEEPTSTLQSRGRVTRWGRGQRWLVFSTGVTADAALEETLQQTARKRGV